jgi:hypothetical protein
MKAFLTLTALLTIMFSNSAYAENDTYCGRFPSSAICSGYYIAPATFGPFALNDSAMMAPQAPSTANVAAAVLADDNVLTSSPAPAVTVPAPDISADEPVNFPEPEPEPTVAVNDILNSLPSPELTESAPEPVIVSSNSEAAASVAPAAQPPAASAPVAAPSESARYCSQYPESPVCMKATTNKTFCEQWPNHKACRPAPGAAPSSAAAPVISAESPVVSASVKP